MSESVPADVTARYDLRFEPWIPFRRANGSVEWLPPFFLSDDLTANPIVGLASPRPDFDAAILEFLIGLFSLALAPTGESEWQKSYRDPPSPAELHHALTGLPDAFALIGDGPRVFQDLDCLVDIEESPIENLLITAAGEQSQDRNTDLFVKRNGVAVLGRPAAAMALLTLQTFAPAGGQGHRTSLRGGGPLVTLAEPRIAPGAEPLWFLVWANAETVTQADERDGDRTRDWQPADTFPWLAPTRTSNPRAGGGPTYCADASPWQVYFGLPRRIRLTISPVPAVCSLTGRPDHVSVSAYRMTNYGVQYLGFQHPLTPHYPGKDAGLLPVHGQPEGVGWRDWQGLLLDDPNGSGRRPAQAVAHFRARRAKGDFRMLVAGYDCDNMKARSWVQAELPAYPDAALVALAAFTRPATAAAELVAKAVTYAVKEAFLQKPKDAPGDYGYLKQALWSRTQQSFFEFVRTVVSDPELNGADLREKFRTTLRDEALAIFDAACPLEMSLDTSHLRRPLVARQRLVITLEGFGKSGNAFFKALDLAPPAPTKQKGTKAA